MKISYSWLNEYLNLTISPDQTSEILTDIGLEVEKVETVEQVKGGLQGLVIGEVTEAIKHPGADTLKITKVNIGTETLSIVCGAPNVDAGQKVVVATVGTILYSENDESFKIKKSKIRGEESFGMICAEDEIGLGKGHDGIMVLDANAKIGTPAAEYFDLKNDTVFEIGLTPNRADAMSHFGVARDLMVALKHKEILPKEAKTCSPSVANWKIDNNDLPITIEVKNTDACPRYAGVTISGIKVEESPEWIKTRLTSIGLSPINNIVDITNYVLHELGQPLHAFDAAKIEGNKVIVDTATAKTKFITLDETERELNEEDLMINNSSKPMCIAGVFGGMDSGVSESTTAIFLESAYFNPVSVRKTAKRHGLNTDASFRFERGIDSETVVYALKRAALMIKDIAGGTISSEIQESYPTPIKNQLVEFNYNNCNRLIGKDIPTQTIDSILENLDIKTLSDDKGTLTLEVPSYRNDVLREADVTEELLRIYGFNNIPLPEKLNTSITFREKTDSRILLNTVLDRLSDNGFAEIMSNSLTKSSYLTTFESKKINPDYAVTMLNPLSSELDVMRQSLIFNGIESIIYNINRKNNDLKLAEFGKTYFKFESGYEENQVLSLFVTGSETSENWDNKTKKDVDFFSIKKEVINTLKRLGIYKNFNINATKNELLTEGLSYSINKKPVVDFGKVSNKVLSHFGIKQAVYYAEINWDSVLQLMMMNKTKYKEMAKFPSSRRDLSLLIDKTVKFEEIEEIASRVDRKILKEIGLFDIYEGKNLAEDKKSYAVSFLFQDENKTLVDKQIEKIMTRIQSELESKLGASLR
ncbi:phenylalanine--tRNA ligase subunit beta [Flavobacteriales bacterium]|nr:phenylalanine--tRNA ligase subunit beta [Flavobacteriales bacterium]